MASPVREFEFVAFMEPEHGDWEEYDYCVRLMETESKRLYDLMYIVGNDSFVVFSDNKLSKEKHDKLVMAGFCFLSVIVK